jgi:hypothetical protein
MTICKDEIVIALFQNNPGSRFVRLPVLTSALIDLNVHHGRSHKLGNFLEDIRLVVDRGDLIREFPVELLAILVRNLSIWDLGL